MKAKFLELDVGTRFLADDEWHVKIPQESLSGYNARRINGQNGKPSFDTDDLRKFELDEEVYTVSVVTAKDVRAESEMDTSPKAQAKRSFEKLKAKKERAMPSKEKAALSSFSDLSDGQRFKKPGNSPWWFEKAGPMSAFAVGKSVDAPTPKNKSIKHFEPGYPVRMPSVGTNGNGIPVKNRGGRPRRRATAETVHETLERVEERQVEATTNGTEAKTITFKRGDYMTVTLVGGFMALAREDRDFVCSIIDMMA